MTHYSQVGSDKMIKEVYNCTLQSGFESSQFTLGQVTLPSSGKALFAGAAADEVSPIRCYRFPLDEQDYTDYAAHCAAVSRVRVSYDESCLFSTGDDGCLFIFDIRKKELSIYN